jgi:hypothetical protein
MQSNLIMVLEAEVSLWDWQKKICRVLFCDCSLFCFRKMGSFVLHMAMKYLEYTLGREDAEGHVLNLAFSSQVLNYLGRIRVPFRTPRIPQTPPRVPPAPSRPGLPIVVGLGGGAILHKAGSFVWSYRWWIGIGLGVCLLGPSVTNYLRRRRSDREQITVNPHGNL